MTSDTPKRNAAISPGANEVVMYDEVAPFTEQDFERTKRVVKPSLSGPSATREVRGPETCVVGPNSPALEVRRDEVS